MKATPFGRYLLLERVSVGGMAEVFKARSEGVGGFGRHVAIKRILPHLAEDRRFVEMFVSEAKVAVHLSHANIAQILELGREGDDHYIAMDYVFGQTVLALHHRLKRDAERLPAAIVAHIGRGVAEGLDYAQRKIGPDGQPLKVVHRDISPQNVMLTYDGAIKLIDFGVAKARISRHRTEAGMLKGKFGYMAPEALEGRGVDHRADVFALGIVLHELITGKRLFNGENDFVTLELVRAAEVPAPSTLNPDCPPELERIVLKALAKRPADRYQTSDLMAHDLGRLLHDLEAASTKVVMRWMQSRFREEWQDERAREAEYAALSATPTPLPLALLEDEDDSDEETALWDAVETIDEPAWVSEPTGPGLQIQSTFEGSPTPRPARLPAPPPPRRRSGLVVLGLLLLLGAAVVGTWAMMTGVFDAPDRRAGLVLKVTPSDALQVRLDDTLIGDSSPIARRDLASGRAQLEIRRAGHEPWTQTVHLQPGQMREITATLVPTQGARTALALKLTPPDAQVQVDGRRLPAGSKVEGPTGQMVELKVTHPGFVPLKKRIELTPGDPLEVTLSPVPSMLTVDSKPRGSVRVELDDGTVIKGRAPFYKSLTKAVSGAWVIVERKGYAPVRERVLFGKDGHGELFIKLQPAP